MFYVDPMTLKSRSRLLNIQILQVVRCFYCKSLVPVAQFGNKLCDHKVPPHCEADDRQQQYIPLYPTGGKIIYGDVLHYKWHYLLEELIDSYMG